MTNTPNFNLSIAEGTDTVNLLTQCYPNFETIDTVMKENKDAAITTATETKTGTNHSIVRANADAEVFRFTATSDYVAGDTFTVDAQAVTVTTPDGQSLQSGAFVINKSVLCCLVGTVLTVFVGGGSSDAQTLGGQLPSYYAKQSDMDIVENDVNTLNSNLTDLETLDFSRTSIPSGTTFNSVVQQLMNKLFPKTFALYDSGVQNVNFGNSGYAYADSSLSIGGFTYNPTNARGVGTNLVMGTIDTVDCSGFSKLKIRYKSAQLNTRMGIMTTKSMYYSTGDKTDSSGTTITLPVSANFTDFEVAIPNTSTKNLYIFVYTVSSSSDITVESITVE